MHNWETVTKVKIMNISITPKSFLLPLYNPFFLVPSSSLGNCFCHYKSVCISRITWYLYRIFLSILMHKIESLVLFSLWHIVIFGLFRALICFLYLVLFFSLTLVPILLYLTYVYPVVLCMVFALYLLLFLILITTLILPVKSVPSGIPCFCLYFLVRLRISLYHSQSPWSLHKSDPGGLHSFQGSLVT